MIRLRHKLFVYVLRALDPLIAFGCLLLSLQLLGSSSRTPFESYADALYSVRDLAGFALLVIGWLVIFSAVVQYDADRFAPLKSELKDAAAATSACAFLLVVIGALFDFDRVDTQAVLLVWGSSVTLTMASRVATRTFLGRVRRSGYNYRNVIIVGHNSRSLDIAARIEASPELGYRLVGFVSESTVAGRAERPSGSSLLGGVEDLQPILERGPVDEVIVCLPMAEHVGTVVRLTRLARELGIVARFFADAASESTLRGLRLERFEGDVVVTLFREQMVWQLAIKRGLDVIVASLMLVVLSPLLAMVAAAIKLTSPGPVLFVQDRVGMNRRIFRFYKFRSMYVDAEARRSALAHLNEMDGPVFKIKNDPRITPLGRFLRKTSIDELPQLINVLRGEMSLVGPRPPLPSEVDQYEWLFRKRLSIKPGITCLWQISGRNTVSFRRWMELDQDYVEHWSLWLDLKILARTLPAVMSSRGAS